MDKMFDVIRNEKRREILVLLTKKEMEVGEIVKEVLISQPQVSMILKELRDRKLVEFVICGKKRIYKINNISMEILVKEIDEFLKKLGWNYGDEIIVRR
jgi:DNA-binding transcriptional ArsR family regulator